MNASVKRLMIVDDDKFLLDMYSIKFKEAGFEVTLCPSSTEALKKIEEGLMPDVILLDMVMPEMNGLELLTKLHGEKNAANASIIVLSNQGQAGDIEEAKKIGVDGYIVKASTIPSEVLDKVQDILLKKHG
jgi:CheY-like chemotaxis protein